FQAIGLFVLLWLPLTLRQIAQLSRRQTKHRRNPDQRQLVKLAVAQLPNFLRTDPRFFRQLGVGQAQTALGFADHVRKSVLQRNHDCCAAPCGNRCRSSIRRRTSFSNSVAASIKEMHWPVSCSIEVMATLTMPQGII